MRPERVVSAASLLAISLLRSSLSLVVLVSRVFIFSLRLLIVSCYIEWTAYVVREIAI